MTGSVPWQDEQDENPTTAGPPAPEVPAAWQSPADLAMVQADEALLTLLGWGVIVMVDDLTRALATWRQRVLAEPVPQLVTTSVALSIVAAARSRRSPGRRWAWLGRWSR